MCSRPASVSRGKKLYDKCCSGGGHGGRRPLPVPCGKASRVGLTQRGQKDLPHSTREGENANRSPEEETLHSLLEGADVPRGRAPAWCSRFRFSENHMDTRTLASFPAWHERSLECWPWVKFTLQKMMYFIWLQDRVLKTLLKQNSQSPRIQTVRLSK